MLSNWYVACVSQMFSYFLCELVFFRIHEPYRLVMHTQNEGQMPQPCSDFLGLVRERPFPQVGESLRLQLSYSTPTLTKKRPNSSAPLLGTSLSERSPHLVISNSLMVEVGWEEEGTERGLTCLISPFFVSPPIKDPEFP